MHSSLIERDNKRLFNDIYGDIADATPLTGQRKARQLIGQLRSIERYTPKYQLEILHVVLKRMCTFVAPDDGLTRSPGGWYEWRFATPLPEDFNEDGK